METTTHTEETITKTTGTNKNPQSGVHAVVKNKMTGDVTTLKRTTKKELGKTLTEMPDYDVLAIFKGRQLNLKEKKAYSFS